MGIWSFITSLCTTDRKNLISGRKGETAYLRQKNCTHKTHTKKKIQLSPQKYRYLEWNERGDNGKECTTTKGKIGQI